MKKKKRQIRTSLKYLKKRLHLRIREILIVFMICLICDYYLKANFQVEVPVYLWIGTSFSTPFVLAGFYRLCSDIRYLRSGLSKADKMSGEEFELYLRAHFTKLGYHVKHVGQTGDFGADLILSKKSKKTVVQAKRYNGSVGVKAVQEVISAKQYYGCDKAMVVTNSYFTKSAKELADTCDVELWDREKCLHIFHS